MLTGALEENLITLLAFDAQRAPIIRGAVDVSLYGGIYRVLASRIYAHIDRFKQPPAEHLPDILSDKLEGKSRESGLYADVIESLYASKGGINAEYVMAQLETFIKRQSLRSIAIDLAKTLQRDTEDSLSEAEALLASAGRQTLTLFDPGTRLSDKSKALDFLDIPNTSLPTGIPELDRRGFGPTRKELWLYVANSKTGKTWMLIQLAKMALMHHVKVCHISLEMSEARSAQRYFQAFFAMSKRKETFNTVRFKRDELGRMSDFEDVQISPKLTLDDPNIRAKLEKKIDKTTRILEDIIIKQFPTGALTVPQLRAYLDNLEVTEHFVPDLLIVDYPDLMKIDKANFRLSIDEIYKDLRGIAVARNLALAVVSQSHRGAANAKHVGAENVAEAYSKFAHSDVTITYSQTGGEKQLGLARLHVAGGRNDEDKISIIVSQQYGIGNFVIDSCLMTGDYWNKIGKGEEND